MANEPTERRLIAILAADMAGYSRMIAADEDGTLARLKANLARLETKVQKHGGRIIKTMGDGVLAQFASAAEALACAVEFQRQMAARKETPRMTFRIGVNAGDAVVTGGDVFGDVVNVAARLQELAPPGGVCVTARVREDAHGRGHLTFEDMGEQRLKHIDRPVRVYRVRLDVENRARPAMALPDKPSIAVLPFDNISGDPAEEYFADAISEDIISALSRWRWFFVIARNSSFIYKGQAVDVTRVGRELGVRYVLEGSVRKAGQRVRVVAQLIDAADATHVWSDSFERDMTDIFALQDEITEHVVNAIEPAMLQSESVRAVRRNVKDLSAFDCFQRGMWHFNQLSREPAQQAQKLFEEAIRRDPELALGHVGLARILYGRVVLGFSDDAQSDLAAAERAARTAIALDARDAWAHHALSGTLLFLGRHEEALEAAEHALALNPNFALGYWRLGQVLLYAGRAREAVAPIERSIRLNPFDPQAHLMLSLLALAHYHAGEYEQTLTHARAALRHGDPRAAALLGAALARLGRFEEARAAFPPEMQQRATQAVRRMIPYARQEDLLDLLEGLRLAGLGAPVLDGLRGGPNTRDKA